MSDKMPAIFVGHGSPMNAVEESEYTENWRRIAEEIGKPSSIIAVSAHWYTDGTRIMDSEDLRMVYDMHGFPDELYEIVYPAKGSPKTAQLAVDLISRPVTIDNTWGIDHGIWSVLKHMYPDADIPVIPLSIDRNANTSEHYRIGRELSALRNTGVLILGSGNIVHNLARIDTYKKTGYPWAVEFDNLIKEHVVSGKHQYVVYYHTGAISSQIAFLTPEHFYPLLYVLGASDQDDTVTVFNDSCLMGALSMTSYVFNKAEPVSPPEKHIKRRKQLIQRIKRRRVVRVFPSGKDFWY